MGDRRPMRNSLAKERKPKRNKILDLLPTEQPIRTLSKRLSTKCLLCAALQVLGSRLGLGRPHVTLKRGGFALPGQPTGRAGWCKPEQWENRLI